MKTYKVLYSIITYYEQVITASDEDEAEKRVTERPRGNLSGLPDFQIDEVSEIKPEESNPSNSIYVGEFKPR